MQQMYYTYRPSYVMPSVCTNATELTVSDFSHSCAVVSLNKCTMLQASWLFLVWFIMWKGGVHLIGTDAYMPNDMFVIFLKASKQANNGKGDNPD